MAVLYNAKSYRDISRFIKGKFTKIKRELSLSWKKAPAYTTIRNIIKGIDAEELEAAFREFMQSQTRYGFNDEVIHIAVDGILYTSPSSLLSSDKKSSREVTC